MECVVEIGRPSLAASRTVQPAPSATATRKGSCVAMAGSSSFVPLNFAARALPTQSAVSEPRNVKPVAQAIARPYVVTPEPHSVATPLKLSLAPLAKLRRTTERINRTVIATPPGHREGLLGRDHSFHWQKRQEVSRIIRCEPSLRIKD